MQPQIKENNISYTFYNTPPTCLINCALQSCNAATLNMQREETVHFFLDI